MIKQALVLVAGRSSRFHPYSKNTHKSEVVVFGKPIISWTLDSLKSQGITEVVVVIAKSSSTLRKTLENHSSDFNELQIVVQDSPKGMADAILTAQPHLNDRFLVINAQHFTADRLITTMKTKNTDVVLSYKPTKNPQRYGVVTIKNDLATNLVEKPSKAIANAQRTVGVYILSQKFVEMMKTLPPSEYLLESALDAFMKNHQVQACLVKENLPTLKYAWDLLSIKNHLFNKIEPSISPQANIASTAIIKGKVHIEPEALIADYAIIDGPAYIGKGAVVGQHCTLRKGSVLEEGAQVQRYCDVSNSIFMKNAHAHSGFIGDSIIGENTRIGADFTTANKRLDRIEIKSYVHNKEVETGLKSLGVIVGHGANIGIKVGTMPNVIIDSGSIVKPGIIVTRNV